MSFDDALILLRGLIHQALVARSRWMIPARLVVVLIDDETCLPQQREYGPGLGIVGSLSTGCDALEETLDVRWA